MTIRKNDIGKAEANNEQGRRGKCEASSDDVICHTLIQTGFSYALSANILDTHKGTKSKKTRVTCEMCFTA